MSDIKDYFEGKMRLKDLAERHGLTKDQANELVNNYIAKSVPTEKEDNIDPVNRFDREDAERNTRDWETAKKLKYMTNQAIDSIIKNTLYIEAKNKKKEHHITWEFLQQTKIFNR